MAVTTKLQWYAVACTLWLMRIRFCIDEQGPILSTWPSESGESAKTFNVAIICAATQALSSTVPRPAMRISVSDELSLGREREYGIYGGTVSICELSKTLGFDFRSVEKSLDPYFDESGVA